MFRLAEFLQQPLYVIEEMSASEIDEWLAYLIVREEEQKKHEAESKAKASAAGRKGRGDDRAFGSPRKIKRYDDDD